MVETYRSVGHTAAMQAAAAAVERGEDNGCPVAAAVVGASGELVAFLRGRSIPFHSAKIAQDKAFTAAGFKMPTAAVYDLVSERDALREGIAHQPHLVMFGGGLPLILDEECIGGIGVSGGTEEMDTACANAGLAAIGAKEF